MSKGSQNGAQIDAKSHQKSIPKLVTKKNMEIIKFHVSLNGKIIEIKFIVKTNIFNVLEVACANGKGIKQQQK